MAATETDEQYFARMEREMRGELEEDYPPSWNFKDDGEGAEILGKVTNMRLATFVDKETQERKQSRIAVIETSTGKKTIWLTRVLSSQFGRENVAIGDFIAVKYLGIQQPEGSGNSYHNFKVVVRKPEGTQIDWSQPNGSPGRRVDDLPSHTGGDAPAADFVADDDIPF